MAEPEQNYEISDEEDLFPERCPICREEFNNPVVTRYEYFYLPDTCSTSSPPLFVISDDE